MTLRECCEDVKSAFHLGAVKVFGNLEEKVKRIAICPGSGKSVIQAALDKNADVLITGDIGHHEGIDAVAQDWQSSMADIMGLNISLLKI